MKSPPRVNQQGFGHILLVIIILVVLGGIGFAGYKVISGRTGTNVTNAASKAAQLAACEESDKNICKYFASMKVQKYYSGNSKTTSDGKTQETTFQADGLTKFHMTVGGETPYEIITIDNTTYTKAPNGVWWKQTAKAEETAKLKKDLKVDTQSDTSTSDEPANKPTYKALGTEACGKLTCYKYQVINSTSSNDKSYIWFDTKDYQLRRTLDEMEDGSVSDTTLSYDKVSIKVPSPVKELGANQYLVPGQNEPTTMPNIGDIQPQLDGSSPTSD
jgi:outer membrane lipoprotein-sorting protein